jgi:hypothetical protein
MAAVNIRTVLIGVLVVGLIVGAVYLVDPTFFGLRKCEGFEGTLSEASNFQQQAGQDEEPGSAQANAVKKNANSAGGDSTSSGFVGAIGSLQGFAGKDGSGNAFTGSKEGFENMAEAAGPAAFDSAQAPAGCYPRDQLTPSELLPRDMNSIWAEQNPMGPGSLKGKNFLSAGALIGVNTVGQSLRNANLQVRSEPPNPQVPVSIFNQSTISPDISHRPLEIGA